MRLIDADELMEHVWRDKLDSREAIAKMVNNAPTVKDIPTKIPIDMFDQADLEQKSINMDMTKGLILGLLSTSDEKAKWMDAIKKVFAPEQNTDVLDKIKEEIEALPKKYSFIDWCYDKYVKEDYVKKIIDKYRGGNDPDGQEKHCNHGSDC